VVLHPPLLWPLSTPRGRQARVHKSDSQKLNFCSLFELQNLSSHGNKNMNPCLFDMALKTSTPDKGE
jgi:hypothetical protein